jgi:LysR family transcriptional regulator, hca operon transcriptional activator
VILPSDHPFAACESIDPRALAGATFIGISENPRVLRAVVNDYLKRCEIEIMPHLEIDNYAMAISLVASTRGVALLPASAENFLPRSVVSRPLKGGAPTIDLVVGYHKANTSAILRTFLSRIDDLISRRAREVVAAPTEIGGSALETEAVSIKATGDPQPTAATRPAGRAPLHLDSAGIDG